MIDLDTPVPNEPREKGAMRVVVAAVLAAAAAVAAIALVVSRDGDDGAPADQPSPTVTVPPTTPPRALIPPPDGTPCTSPGPCNENELVPGTYFVDEVGGTPTPRIFFTIGAGWPTFDFYMPSSERSIMKPGVGPNDGGGGSIAFRRPSAVFSDACHWSDGYHPGPVDTVDGFVAALSEQGGCPT